MLGCCDMHICFCLRGITKYFTKSNYSCRGAYRVCMNNMQKLDCLDGCKPMQVQQAVEQIVQGMANYRIEVLFFLV